ncbi:hypothetical protein [Actinomadura rubrisoli]|uniref:Uncharacterized protein n=1 Tax=Actinomadura rubrisoli TaxID=2530368 RepID=A0A4R5CE67_9ACTN|nr:hypothetical protein [Actinomadura rubrisoli]TDD97206.1 hypothetical protein E1298_01855 [Actinomadura rubrisoli]
MRIRNLADVKRAMTAGTTVTVVNHVYPALSGRRTVVKAQAQRWSLSLPEDHPNYKGPEDGSWMDIPPASRCEFDGGSSVVIYRDPDWQDSGPFVTITFD